MIYNPLVEINTNYKNWNKIDNTIMILLNLKELVNKKNENTIKLLIKRIIKCNESNSLNEELELRICDLYFCDEINKLHLFKIGSLFKKNIIRTCNLIGDEIKDEKNKTYKIINYNLFKQSINDDDNNKEVWPSDYEFRILFINNVKKKKRFSILFKNINVQNYYYSNFIVSKFFTKTKDIIKEIKKLLIFKWYLNLYNKLLNFENKKIFEKNLILKKYLDLYYIKSNNSKNLKKKDESINDMKFSNQIFSSNYQDSQKNNKYLKNSTKKEFLENKSNISSKRMEEINEVFEINETLDENKSKIHSNNKDYNIIVNDSIKFNDSDKFKEFKEFKKEHHTFDKENNKNYKNKLALDYKPKIAKKSIKDFIFPKNLKKPDLDIISDAKEISSNDDFSNENTNNENINNKNIEIWKKYNFSYILNYFCINIDFQNFKIFNKLDYIKSKILECLPIIEFGDANNNIKVKIKDITDYFFVYKVFDMVSSDFKIKISNNIFEINIEDDILDNTDIIQSNNYLVVKKYVNLLNYKLEIILNFEINFNKKFEFFKHIIYFQFNTITNSSYDSYNYYLNYSKFILTKKVQVDLIFNKGVDFLLKNKIKDDISLFFYLLFNNFGQNNRINYIDKKYKYGNFEKYNPKMFEKFYQFLSEYDGNKYLMNKLFFSCINRLKFKINNKFFSLLKFICNLNYVNNYIEYEKMIFYYIDLDYLNIDIPTFHKKNHYFIFLLKKFDIQIFEIINKFHFPLEFILDKIDLVKFIDKNIYQIILDIKTFLDVNEDKMFIKTHQIFEKLFLYSILKEKKILIEKITLNFNFFKNWKLILKLNLIDYKFNIIEVLEYINLLEKNNFYLEEFKSVYLSNNIDNIDNISNISEINISEKIKNLSQENNNYFDLNSNNENMIYNKFDIKINYFLQEKLDFNIILKNQLFFNSVENFNIEKYSYNSNIVNIIDINNDHLDLRDIFNYINKQSKYKDKNLKYLYELDNKQYILNEIINYIDYKFNKINIMNYLLFKNNNIFLIEKAYIFKEEVYIDLTNFITKHFFINSIIYNKYNITFTSAFFDELSEIIVNSLENGIPKYLIDFEIIFIIKNFKEFSVKFKVNLDEDLKVELFNEDINCFKINFDNLNYNYIFKKILNYGINKYTNLDKINFINSKKIKINIFCRNKKIFELVINFNILDDILDYNKNLLNFDEKIRKDMEFFSLSFELDISLLYLDNLYLFMDVVLEKCAIVNIDTIYNIIKLKGYNIKINNLNNKNINIKEIINHEEITVNYF